MDTVDNRSQHRPEALGTRLGNSKYIFLILGATCSSMLLFIIVRWMFIFCSSVMLKLKYSKNKGSSPRGHKVIGSTHATDYIFTCKRRMKL